MDDIIRRQDAINAMDCKFTVTGADREQMKIMAMNFPYRKKKCLGIYDPAENAWIKVATFNNDNAAEVFFDYLKDMIELMKEYDREDRRYIDSVECKDCKFSDEFQGDIWLCRRCKRSVIVLPTDKCSKAKRRTP